MSQVKFNWTVQSVDDINGTMVVKYTLEDDEKGIEINIQKPALGSSEDEVRAHIEKNVPKHLWAVASRSFANVPVGVSGRANLVLETAITETPNIFGTWSEEYLRAVIYQVLEEIRESEA